MKSRLTEAQTWFEPLFFHIRLDSGKIEEKLVGKQHCLAVYGCCNPKELDNLDDTETAWLLMSEQQGHVTPYGVVYDNGVKLGEAYDGRHLPPSKQGKNCVMELLIGMAHEKVNAQLLGFKINDAQTTKNGNAETFTLFAPWQIAENSKLPLSYDAVVSAVSQPVNREEVFIRKHKHS